MVWRKQLEVPTALKCRLPLCGVIFDPCRIIRELCAPGTYFKCKHVRRNEKKGVGPTGPRNFHCRISLSVCYTLEK